MTITVNSINDDPIATDDATSVVEDSGATAIDVLANDNDPDAGDSVSISSVGATDNDGTAVTNAGQIDYTPAPNFVGTETFTYTISDNNGGFDTAMVTITVTDNPANDTPTANADSETVVEDSGTTAIDVLDNDTDPDAGDTLIISAVGATDNDGTAVTNAGQIDYTPAPNFVGTEVFTYTISDNNGGFDTATVTITVTDNPTNDTPTANADSETVVEDSGTTAIDVLDNDTDPDAGDTLIISAVGATDNDGTAVSNAGQIDYTPAPNFVGTETFTYTISDGNGGSDSATVTITVTDNPTNDTPTANADSETVVEDSGTTAIDVLDNDTDPDTGDTLIISAVGVTDNDGTAVSNAGQIDYTPAPNFVGTETFTYTLSDGNGGSDIATVTITVTESPINDNPIANDDSRSITEDSGLIQIDVLANDNDPDMANTLSIVAVGATDNGGTAVENSGQIDYTPALNFVGTETFTYTISDSNGGSDTATVSINVGGSNDPPQAQDDARQTFEDAMITIDVLDNDTDLDGDSLTILSVNGAVNGTAVIQGNQIKYTPHPHYYGTDTFTYTMSDGEFNDTAIVTVTIVSVNDLPDAVDDSATTTAGTKVIIEPLENDIDFVEGSPLTIVSLSNPANGTITTNGTTITYTPNSGFIGVDQITYTISDGQDTVTATVSVTVNMAQLFLPIIISP